MIGLAYKFDLEKYIKEYEKEYDKLPNHPDKDKNPSPTKDSKYDEFSKDTAVSPTTHRARLEATIKDNKGNSACTTCPKNGKCRYLKWNADHTFLKVTGCSGHPDQKKFKGHSTTVVFTDSLYANYMPSWDGTWANAWTSSSSQNNTPTPAHGAIGRSGGLYYIYRGAYFWDSSAIPDDATVTAGTFQGYIDAILSQYGTRQLQVLLSTTLTDPPVGLADYNKALDVAEISTIVSATATLNAYNDWILNPTGLAAISKIGFTKFKQRYSGDVDNEAPGGDGDFGVVTQGSTGANPPKLEVTYNPAGPASVDPADGKNKCQDLKNNVNWLFSKPAGSGVVQKMMQELT